MWLLDRNENLKGQIQLLNGKHTETLNGANYLEFSCLNDVRKGDRVLYRDTNLHWHEFIVVEIEEERNEAFIYAEHSSYELQGRFIEDLRSEQQPNEHLKRLLEKTRWEVGTVEYKDKIKKMYYRKSVYEAIGDLVRAIDGEIQFRIEVDENKVVKRYVDIVEHRGFDVGKRFEYGKDIEKATKTVLRDNVITALYGFGKGEEIGDGHGRRINFGDLDKPDSPKGQMFIVDEEARKEWGINNKAGGKDHFFGKVEFDDIEDKEELYIATKSRLETLSKPLINYDVEVVLLGNEHENVSIGDTVAIIDNDFNDKDLRVKGRIFKLERDLINPSKSKVEIGNYMSDILDETISLDKYINNFRDKEGAWDSNNPYDEDGMIPSNKIKDILDVWNKEINSLGGFIYGEDGEGLMTYDRAIDDNPTRVVQIVGGAIRIANSKKSDGSWDWRTVMTADGIHGQEIVANSITVEQLSNGIGSEIDISNNESMKLLVKQLNSRNVWVNSSGIAGVARYTFESPPLIMGKGLYKMGEFAGYVMGSGIPIMHSVNTETRAKRGLEFRATGKAVNSRTQVKASEKHFLRMLGKGYGSQAKMYINEYIHRDAKEPINTIEMPLFKDTEDFEVYETEIDFSNDTIYIEIVMEFERDEDKLFTIADGMLTEGDYQDYEPTAEEIILFTQSSIELMEGSIKLVAKETDILGNAINSSKAKLSPDKGLETWGNGITAYDQSGNKALYLDSNTGNLTISGDIHAGNGNVGDFDIKNGTLTTEQQKETKKFVEADVERIKQIITGEVAPTAQDFDELDVNGDGDITTADYMIVKRAVVDVYPNPITYIEKVELGAGKTGILSFRSLDVPGIPQVKQTKVMPARVESERMVANSVNAARLYTTKGMLINYVQDLEINNNFNPFVSYKQDHNGFWFRGGNLRAVSGDENLGTTGNRFAGVYLKSNPNVSSDIRHKEIKGKVTDARKFMKLVDVYEYTNKDNPRTIANGLNNIGFIAQEIERANYILGKEKASYLAKEESYLSLDYVQILLYNWQVTKELMEENESLQKRLDKQQSEIDDLKQLVKGLIK